MIVLMKYTVRQLLRKVKSCILMHHSLNGENRGFSFLRSEFNPRWCNFKNNLKFIKIFDIIYIENEKRNIFLRELNFETP